MHDRGRYVKLSLSLKVLRLAPNGLAVRAVFFFLSVFLVLFYYNYTPLTVFVTLPHEEKECGASVQPQPSHRKFYALVFFSFLHVY